MADLSFVRNRVEDVGQESRLVVVPARSKRKFKRCEEQRNRNSRHASFSFGPLLHVYLSSAHLSGREVSQSLSIAVVSARTDTLWSVVNCETKARSAGSWSEGHIVIANILLGLCRNHDGNDVYMVGTSPLRGS